MSSVKVTRASIFSLKISEIAPDKSISHRCAMFAMLADGTSEITNFLRAEDTLNSLEIVKNLGATVSDNGVTIKISSDGIKESSEILDCGNSGTGMRLFCGLLSSANGHFVLTGDKYLRRRPMKRVTSPLRDIGAKLDGRDNGDLAPISIRGSSLKAFNYESKIASAQVKSAMILAALRADGTCTFTEPELSRDHTERMLKGMGADIKVDGLKTTIKPMTKLLSPLKIRVPSDPSSAFFFAVAAAITPDSDVFLEGVTLNPTRIEAFKALERMGADISYEITDNKYEPIGNIHVKYAPLKAITVEDNISWLIDELPALSIAFACADGVSVVKNAEELRVKESDRISTVVNGLRDCGIEVDEVKDGYSVKGGKLQASVIDSHGDHRIAMSFIIAGLKCGMSVSDVDCINTSFPNFFELLQKITKVEFTSL
ncbi:MAG: 3-phosphoshikimate 1-carboxyvinyltransferase [Sulfurimonas sp. RIFOXYD12_FULL_33_39]|uniref:3-phosphoshikimate 1-carboxyvinyltransferase n=1 Tax=unclassified Sulfurimonas TaxID=2623549 RepID=UPI0008AD19D0|nr:MULTISPECIES: 3-phosphoshikimate 1-carboxyvinyltransferase [unclassified Sulfurimonas]OHE02667.1 MAG: 3-phosphoshikimate 1-carboxyvinyltransferase [Sulfurimonas sp. RIFCSPLOWO2_12_FULL_34_6]OHE08865.1 MAG: 3-phosphoshikimate 1-carboxyvinyltransferase [Sulfurimonas sp. RIFOXYD12_FULL_33_39]OHE14175.1 MAG: 3-phosphoshikimate 1-carboxyvinyltransferase [Sulfurimonas sp. RIFOXYD2_FULL_34_21]